MPTTKAPLTRSKLMIYATKGLQFIAPGLAIVLFPSEVLRGIGQGHLELGDPLAIGILCAVYALHLVVLGIALRPAILLRALGGTQSRSLANAIDLEQRNMPNLMTVLAKASKDPTLVKALRVYCLGSVC
jgi:hypothetical protein